MSLIDSTKSNSCFESISVGSQIIHYIDNIANEILHLLGKSWRWLYNTLQSDISKKRRKLVGGGGKERGRKENGEGRENSGKTEYRDGEGRKGAWERAGRRKGNERGKAGKGH